MQKTLQALVVLVAGIVVSGVANAEYFGAPNGRSADLSRMADLSVEGTFVTGDLADADYDYFGLRVNYRVAPGFLVFGDLGKADFGVLDDTAFGLGVFYQLQDLISNLDSTAKVSYHTADFGFGIDVDLIAVELLLSGLEQISDNGLNWYGNIGIHRLSGSGDSDTELGFGGGLMLPVGPGEAYFGIDHVDDITFGIGFRYDL